MDVRFQSGFPLPILLLVAAAGVAWVVWRYRAGAGAMRRPYAVLLPALRATAVTLVVLTFARPVIHQRRVVGTLGRILFAIDSSRSMSRFDMPAGISAESEFSSSAVPSRRIEAASDLLWGEAPPGDWTGRLSATHEMEAVTFSGGQATRVWNAQSAGSPPIAARGEQSRLRGALEYAAMRRDSDSDSGFGAASAADSDSIRRDAASTTLVILSDGQDTSGAPVADAARSLRKSGVTVHAIGIGPRTAPPSVRVRSVSRPQRVPRGGVIAGTIELQQSGAARRRVQVELQAGRRVVWERKLTLGRAGRQPIPFSVALDTLSPDAGGDRLGDANEHAEPESTDAPYRRLLEFHARVRFVDSTLAPSQPDGDSPAKATRQLSSIPDSAPVTFRVAALNRKRRLLILDRSSRWETRYLRNSFDRDPSWIVDTVLLDATTGEESVSASGSSSELADSPERLELPSSSAEWSQYDLILFGEVGPRQMRAVDQAAIVDFVAAGGGVIFIDGRYHQLRQFHGARRNGRRVEGTGDPDPGDSISKLLPVTFEPPARVAPGSESSVERAGWTPDVRVAGVRRTPVGRAQRFLDLDASTTAGRRQESDAPSVARDRWWRQLPRPSHANRVWAAPGADVWVEITTPEGDATPWMVHRRFGGGRVVYLASGHTWRWRYKITDRIHRRFWHQLAAAAGAKPYDVQAGLLRLSTDRIEYVVGERASVRARLTLPDATASLPETVDAVLLHGDQVVATFPMQPSDGGSGDFVAVTDPLELPEHWSSRNSAPNETAPFDARRGAVLRQDAVYRIAIRAGGWSADSLAATTEIRVVRPPDDETADAGVNSELLSAVAREGGGLYVHWEDADRVFERIRPTSGGRIVETDLPLWNTFPWFAVILSLLVAEWILRKRVGLV